MSWLPVTGSIQALVGITLRQTPSSSSGHVLTSVCSRGACQRRRYGTSVDIFRYRSERQGGHILGPDGICVLWGREAVVLFNKSSPAPRWTTVDGGEGGGTTNMLSEKPRWIPPSKNPRGQVVRETLQAETVIGELFCPLSFSLSLFPFLYFTLYLFLPLSLFLSHTFSLSLTPSPYLSSFLQLSLPLFFSLTLLLFLALLYLFHSLFPISISRPTAYTFI